MNCLNYTNAFLDCFGFHIVQINNILSNQATLPYCKGNWPGLLLGAYRCLLSSSSGSFMQHSNCLTGGNWQK